MSWFTKWAFQNKAAVSIMSILTLLMGVVSYLTLPMEFLPPIDQPQVSVVVMGQGVDAATMENQVTKPIETAVTTVSRKRNIFSTTGDGYSKIDIFFEPKTDKKNAKQEIQDALSTITLPSNVSQPSIVQLNTSMIPIADVAVTFDDGLTPSNLEFAKEELSPYFKDIKGVANIQTFGTTESFISIQVKNKEMGEKQVSLESIMTVLQGQNMAASIGEKTIDGKASNLKVVGDVNKIEDLKKLTVAPNTSLSDVASIELKKAENTLTRINGKDGLLFIVTKDSHSNAVSISHEIKKATKEINDKYDHVKATVILATADMVENSVNSMMKEVLLGALFATIVIMIFLRNIRSTFITIVSIPLSLGLTLFLLAKSGITLNILTLGGIAVAVGRLVDDSIVVIENIFHRAQRKKVTAELIMDATKEVGAAITSSTLTTVAVFLPIGLVNGDLQDLVLPFALTITYSLLTSLIVALTVVPLMSAGLLKNAKLKEHKPAVRFKSLLSWSLNHKWVILLASFVMFAGSIGAYFAMPKGTVNRSTVDFMQVTLDYPNDTPIENVKDNTQKLEAFLLEQDDVKYLFTQLGNSADAAKYGEIGSPTKASYMLILKEDVDSEALTKKIEEQKGSYSDAKLTAGAGSLTGSGEPQITIDVVGEKLSDLEAAAEDIKAKIADIKGVETVETNQEEKKTVYSFVVDPSKAKAEQVAQQLAVMFNRMPMGTIMVDDQQTPVLLEPVLDPKKESDLKDINLVTPAGTVPVSEIATLKKEEQPTNVFHKDGDSYIRVTATVEADQLSVISAEINKALFGEKPGKGMDFPEGVEILVGGASAQQADDFTDLFMTMLASIGIVFLIMVITFKTLRAPIAILFSLPLAAIGAILGLLISRIAVDPTALLGALMLIGVVVTNAIVLLDRVKKNEATMTIRDAILDAAATRMRPILMTAVATICAMLPLLFKKSEMGSLVSANLAVVVIGGLSVATLLTLVVIPVVYELLHFKKAKQQRLQKETDAAL